MSKTINRFFSKQSDNAQVALQYLLIFILTAILIYAVMYAYNLSKSASDAAVKKEQFYQSDVRRDEIVLVHADFCGHCKQFMPKFKRVSEEMKGAYEFKHFEINEPGAKQYKVSAFPTVLYIRNGATIDQISGNQDETRFKSWILQQR